MPSREVAITDTGHLGDTACENCHFVLELPDAIPNLLRNQSKGDQIEVVVIPAKLAKYSIDMPPLLGAAPTGPKK